MIGKKNRGTCAGAGVTLRIFWIRRARDLKCSGMVSCETAKIILNFGLTFTHTCMMPIFLLWWASTLEFIGKITAVIVKDKLNPFGQGLKPKGSDIQSTSRAASNIAANGIFGSVLGMRTVWTIDLLLSSAWVKQHSCHSAATFTLI